jgi:SAM-dependent methyltransferase
LDLRKLVSSPKIIVQARKLAMRGQLNYQPYIFSEDLAVGSGLSIVAGHSKDVPSIYCPELKAEGPSADYLARELVRPEQKTEFFAANERMRRFYDGVVDQIAASLGTVKGLSVLDVGCNTGYFPVSFARRGAARAVGFDRVDYSDAVALLNGLCGTNVEFRPWSYDGSIKAEERFDLVLSVAVLVHLSDPLQHLAWLGSSAAKALFVFTPCRDDDDYSIRFHTVNRYYADQFPYCFDVTTLSKKLLRLSLEQMGFTKIVEIEVVEDSMPPAWSRVHLGLLGIRETVAAPPVSGNARPLSAASGFRSIFRRT